MGAPCNTHCQFFSTLPETVTYLGQCDIPLYSEAVFTDHGRLSQNTLSLTGVGALLGRHIANSCKNIIISEYLGDIFSMKASKYQEVKEFLLLSRMGCKCPYISPMSPKYVPHIPLYDWIRLPTNQPIRSGI